MSAEVKLSRATLVCLCVGLVASLIAVGFLLGRQGSASPAVHETASVSPPLAVAQPTLEPADRSLDARLDAIDQRLANIKRKEGGRLKVGGPVSTPAYAANASPDLSGETHRLAATQDYFRRVDSIVGGKAAMANSQPMAARLLEQALGGSEGQFDVVVKRAAEARAELSKVVAPKECAEHHRLLLGQLSGAVALLGEVRTAMRTGDTRTLSTLSASADEIGDDARRLQSLARKLRAQL